MSDTPKMPERIEYEYVETEDCKRAYSHGIWGGVNARGEVEMNFYLETDKLPRTSRRELDPERGAGPEVFESDGAVKRVERRVEARVLMSYQSARAALTWLEDKVRLIEKENRRAREVFRDQGGRGQ